MKGKRREDIENTFTNDDHYLQTTDRAPGTWQFAFSDLACTQIHSLFFFFFLRTDSEISAALAGYRLECRSKWDFKRRLCEDRWRRLGELISGCSDHNTDFISQALPLSQTYSYSMPENIVISAFSLLFSRFKAISLWYLASCACQCVCLCVYAHVCV